MCIIISFYENNWGKLPFWTHFPKSWTHFPFFLKLDISLKNCFLWCSTLVGGNHKTQFDSFMMSSSPVRSPSPVQESVSAVSRGCLSNLTASTPASCGGNNSGNYSHLLVGVNMDLPFLGCFRCGGGSHVTQCLSGKHRCGGRMVIYIRNSWAALPLYSWGPAFVNSLLYFSFLRVFCKRT